MQCATQEKLKRITAAGNKIKKHTLYECAFYLF